MVSIDTRQGLEGVLTQINDQLNECKAILVWVEKPNEVVNRMSGEEKRKYLGSITQHPYYRLMIGLEKIRESLYREFPYLKPKISDPRLAFGLE